MPSAKTKLGRRGEDQAARFLRRLGHKIIARNYLCPIGEIDLVTIDGDTLVFVEVKTLSSDKAAEPQDHVGFTKQRQVRRVADYYLAKHNAHDRPLRFDVVAVLLPVSGRAQITHFVNAF